MTAALAQVQRNAEKPRAEYWLRYRPGLIGAFRCQYGAPEYIGVLDWARADVWPAYLYPIGPVYVGPIPAEDAALWPEAECRDLAWRYMIHVWDGRRYVRRWAISFVEKFELLGITK